MIVKMMVRSLFLCCYVMLVTQNYKERKSDKAVRQYAKRKNAIIAVRKKDSSFIRWIKHSKVNRHAVFALTTTGGMLVIDLSGQKIAELYLPCDAQNFDLTETGIVLKNTREETEYPLEAIEWFYSGSRLELPESTACLVSVKAYPKTIVISRENRKCKFRDWNMGAKFSILYLSCIVLLYIAFRI